MSFNAYDRHGLVGRPKIYIAGPITSSGNLSSNVRNGMSVGTEVYAIGGVPFIPHLSELVNLSSDKMTWDDWIDYDKEWIRSCDALFRLPGKSKGAAREVRLMRKLGRPVFKKWVKLYAFIKEWERQLVAKGKKKKHQKAK